MARTKDRTGYLKGYLVDYRVRNRCLNITVPLADYKKLEKAARREGKKPTRLLVELGLMHLDAVLYVPAELKGELAQFQRLVRNVANNLNQIAHHTNTVKQAADKGQVFAWLKQLERHVESYTLGRLKAHHDHQVNEP